MSAVFSPRGELAVKLVLTAMFAGLLILVGLAAFRTRADLAIGKPIAQPVPFSHKHHVGDDGIDCRYCHETVETSAFAGMPATSTCLTCHSQLFADSPMLEPVRRSAASGQPIAWNRVHKLPDFVYFNHSIHVAKGVACKECHGRIDQMPLTWRAQPLQMQWCLDCHRDPAPHLRPPEQVFDMQAPPSTPAQGALLAKALHLQSRARLTDCSTCHR